MEIVTTFQNEMQICSFFKFYMYLTMIETHVMYWGKYNNNKLPKNKFKKSFLWKKIFWSKRICKRIHNPFICQCCWFIWLWLDLVWSPSFDGGWKYCVSIIIVIFNQTLRLSYFLIFWWVIYFKVYFSMSGHFSNRPQNMHILKMNVYSSMTIMQLVKASCNKIHSKC